MAPIVASYLLYYSADQFQAPVKLMESVQEKELGWMGVQRVQLKLFAKKMAWQRLPLKTQTVKELWQTAKKP